MVNIPMTSKKPMRASELGQMNRTGGGQTLRALQTGRPAFGQGASSVPQPGQGRSTSMPQPGRSRSASVPQPERGRSVLPSLPPERSRNSSPPPARTAPRRQHPPASGIALQKGQKISLSQINPGLSRIEVGMGWELGPGGRGYDLDVEAFLLDQSGKVPGDDWFVFYNQPVSPDGAVRLVENGISGTGPSDDETIQIQLDRLNPGVARITFIVTINEALARGYNFGNVADAYVRIVDQPACRELVRFRLTDYYSNVCSMVVGEVYRYKNEWRFNPVGNGTGDDLAGLCRRYGVNA